jgi:predicted MFS family arabinose efflux permease
MTDLSLLKNPLFFIPCLTNLFGAVGLFIPFVYIAKRAIDLDVPKQNAAFLLSVIGK